MKIVDSVCSITGASDSHCDATNVAAWDSELCILDHLQRHVAAQIADMVLVVACGICPPGSGRRARFERVELGEHARLKRLSRRH